MCLCVIFTATGHCTKKNYEIYKNVHASKYEYKY